MEVYSWEPVSCCFNRQSRHKEVDCWFGSDSIGLLTEASHKFVSRPSILALEGNSILSEDKKQLSSNYLYQVQRSACVVVTTEKFCMGHHHYLYAHNKHTDAL